MARQRTAAYFSAHPLAIDLVLCGMATLVGGLLRLVRLGDVPYGVHPDEAQIGTDAFRVIDHGWIGVYSHATLGVPTLNAYIDAPSIWLLGHTAFTLRLPLALVGLAAVPLLYAVVRVAYARAEAFFAAMLLAVSYWHIFYSRLAHSSITYPTVLLAAVLCIMLGLRDGRRRWFAGAGAFLGLGIYAYNVDAIAVVAVAAFFGILSLPLIRSRTPQPASGQTPASNPRSSVQPPASKLQYTPPRIEPRNWLACVAICFGVALVVAMPFIDYVSDPGAYYWEHIDNYRDTGVTRTPEYRAASTTGRAKIIGKQLRDFARAYVSGGPRDIVDANGLRPMFRPLLLLLLAGGIALAIARRREPLVIAAACFIVILPLPALLQRGSMMREPLGAAPFLMFIAALPLGWLWRRGMEDKQPAARLLVGSLVALPVVVIGAFTVHDYFWTWRDDPLTRFVYHQEITSASAYMKTLPRDGYVYFYSERHPLGLETRQFLAPGVEGEDRSAEFSDADGSIDDIDRSRPVTFVLLGDYLGLLPDIEQRYPGGTERVVMHGSDTDFEAYELPPA